MDCGSCKQTPAVRRCPTEALPLSLRGVLTACVAAAGCLAAVPARARDTAGEPWADALSGRGPKEWTAIGAGRHRCARGQLEVQAEPGKRWTTLPLGDAGPGAREWELELRWAPRGSGKSGGVEVALGPHGVGSSGYRLVASRRPWRVVECRGPRLAPRQWHSLRLCSNGSWMEYWLGRSLVARCPVDGAGALRLVVDPATEVTVRRCRHRAWHPEQAFTTRFRYPVPWFSNGGFLIDDPSSEDGKAVGLWGDGEGRWLVWGQDGSLAASGPHRAVFGLRSVAGGAGRVEVAVARAGGPVVASRTVQMEEIPARRYQRAAVPFAYEAGWTMEYRVAATKGALFRVDSVVVTPAARPDTGSKPLPGNGIRRERPRRPPPLAEAWPTRAKRRSHAGLSIVRLERRLLDGGTYEVRVLWRQGAKQAADGLAADLWISCRDEWGRVKTFDYGLAYDGAAPGLHTTAAQLDAARCRRYGPPGSLFVQLYRGGTPLASAWRKWGIPVENKYILPARRVGRLREGKPPTETTEPRATGGPRNPSPPVPSNAS